VTQFEPRRSVHAVSDAPPDGSTDTRFGTYLRLFGRTPESKIYGPIALLFGVALYLRKGIVEALVVLGCTIIVAVPLGYVRWRNRQGD